MKRIIWIIASVIMLNACSISDTRNVSFSYEIEDVTYIDEMINIHYPKIIIDDHNLNERVNKLIESHIFENYVYEPADRIIEFEELHGIKDTYQIDLDFEIHYKDNDIISIYLYGNGRFGTSSSYSYIGKGLTIKISEARLMSPSEFIDIDEKLLQKMSDSKNVKNHRLDSSSKKLNLESFLQQKNNDFELFHDYLLEILSSDSGKYTYVLDEETIWISVPFVNAGGGYLLVEVER